MPASCIWIAHMPVNRRSFTAQQTGHLNGHPDGLSSQHDMSPAASANSHSGHATEQDPLISPGPAGGKASKSRLTTYEESLRDVPWQTDNEWIVTGYRRQIPSIRGCLWSAVGCEYLNGQTASYCIADMAC